jgi:hypothetical protein
MKQSSDTLVTKLTLLGSPTYQVYGPAASQVLAWSLAEYNQRDFGEE